MKKQLIGSIILGALTLGILFSLINTLFGIPSHFIQIHWNLLANLLISLAILLLVRNNILKQWPLALFIFLVYFLIGHFNILIEAYIFDVTNRPQTLLEIGRGFLVVALFAPITTFLYKKSNSSSDSLSFPSRSYVNWSWRVLLGNILYLFLYMLAGMILVTIYPELLTFYEGKVPPIDLILKTQLFIRGFLFVGVAMAILRTIDLPLFQRACILGGTFSIMGGIAPLIPENELMPLFVRMGHLFEVGISNFVYGFILGYLLGQRRIGG